MQFIVTKDCESHRVNQNYKTLLLVWTGCENNVRPLGFTGNWQPTDSEGKEFVKRLSEISPTFASWLVGFAVNLNVPNFALRSMPKRQIEKLEDVLF